MTTVISVENLSKVYRLGQIGTGTLTYDMQLWWARVRGKPNPLSRIGETDHDNRVGEELWALKDVSFKVEQGEVLGIIGRNGAGKSTLLKILSRVTAPTSGRIRVKGRIASLLEVGTGFHPELTGRENIYLNGAILGMNRKEIDRKFDEIVNFAEVEKFIDTPVKRYSSGMYVRLAFAVAAHLEPEILVVDEVLAVGDGEFQKKCLGKMGAVAKEGRTVLFVSHNMTAINSLCTRGFLLSKGMVSKIGAIDSVLHAYQKIDREDFGEITWDNVEESPGNHLVKLRAVRIVSDEKIRGQVDIDKDAFVEIEYQILSQGIRLVTEIRLSDDLGNVVVDTYNTDEANLSRDPLYYQPLPVGLYKATCKIPGNFLNEKRYFIGVYIATLTPTEAHVMVKEALSFNVFDTGRMRSPGLSGRWFGLVRTKFDWHTHALLEME